MNLEKSISNRRVLVVSGDTLPLPGLPTTGAGLRAWGLGEGLKSRGHEVLYLMPEATLKHAPAGVDTTPYRPLVYNNFDPNALSHCLRVLQPDVIILQHWIAAGGLGANNRIPTVIDFHGPLLLETLYQDLPHYEKLRQLKVGLLPRADFFTCAGEQQRHYFYPWLLWSGFDVRDDVIQVIPVSMSPDIPRRGSLYPETTFVYGGVFLPWQDPSVSLETLVQTLEDRQMGCLQIFGGLHPHVQVPPGKYRELIPRLQKSSRVQMMGMVARDVLVQNYLRSHVAIDLMARNPERELAFTTRTVEYLWCGLPVIYNNYAELAHYIQDYDAGWIVDPQDVRAIRAVIESILDDPESVVRKSLNAQTLVRERLSWDRTIEPLDAFCRQPFKRAAGSLKPVLHLTDLKESKEEFAARVRIHIRRMRRNFLSRSLALVTAAAKRLLKPRYIIDLFGEKVKVTEPLLRGQKIGQVFRAEEAYLCGIALAIGILNRINTCDLILHLCDAQDETEDIAVTQINALIVEDSILCDFPFKSIADSANRVFYFWVESPDAVLGDCVVLFRNLKDNSLVFSPRYGSQQDEVFLPG